MRWIWNRNRSTVSRKSRRTLDRAIRPCLEGLESRVLLSTYYVDDWDTVSQAFVSHGTNTHKIATDFSGEVGGKLELCIGDVPDGNTLVFPSLSYSKGTVGYQVDNIIKITGRNNIT